MTHQVLFFLRVSMMFLKTSRNVNSRQNLLPSDDIPLELSPTFHKIVFFLSSEKNKIVYRDRTH